MAMPATTNALARTLFPEVLAITGAVMDYAKQIADKYDDNSARDAVRATVIAEYKLDGICTFDQDFDRIRGCKRGRTGSCAFRSITAKNTCRNGPAPP